MLPSPKNTVCWIIKKGFSFSDLLFLQPKSSFTSPKKILRYWFFLLALLDAAKCSFIELYANMNFSETLFTGLLVGVDI